LRSGRYFASAVVPNPFTDSDTRQIEEGFSRALSRAFSVNIRLAEEGNKSRDSAIELGTVTEAKDMYQLWSSTSF
jgi:hypothetical protein